MGNVVRRLIAGLLLCAGGGAAAWGSDPRPYQLGFADPVAPDAVMQIEFHNQLLLPITTVIVLIVVALLWYVCYRFSEKRNPVPSKVTHNSVLEVVWTLIPVLVLAVIVFPSLRVLYASAAVPDAGLTLKVTGHQWYWSYEYPDEGVASFDSTLLARTEEDAQRLGVRRLMDVDNPVFVPTGVTVRLLLTSGDVIHNWAVSELGVRTDAVPGRLNEEAFLIPEGKEGVYYGFCSELCGVDHSYMPIVVHAVTQQEFQEWLRQKQPPAVGGEAANAADVPPAAGAL